MLEHSYNLTGRFTAHTHKVCSPSLKIVFLSLKIVFVFASSVDQDERLHYAAFHLGLHCLPKYSLRNQQYTKGWFLTCI